MIVLDKDHILCGEKKGFIQIIAVEEDEVVLTEVFEAFRCQTEFWRVFIRDCVCLENSIDSFAVRSVELGLDMSHQAVKFSSVERPVSIRLGEVTITSAAM